MGERSGSSRIRRVPLLIADVGEQFEHVADRSLPTTPAPTTPVFRIPETGSSNAVTAVVAAAILAIGIIVVRT